MTDKKPIFYRMHFEAIAMLLSHTEDKELIKRCVDFFSDDNPKFARIQFLNAVHKQSMLRRERNHLRTIRPEIEAGITHKDGEQYVG